jgi:cytochrome P450
MHVEFVLSNSCSCFHKVHDEIYEKYIYFCSFQLARNLNAQEKLRHELLSVVDENENISYEQLMELPYLDQVIYESLRINPPLTFSNRECSETIELEGVKGHKVKIEKGQRVFIPILSYHHDEGKVNSVLTLKFKN